MVFGKCRKLVPAFFFLLLLTGCAAMPAGEYSESAAQVFGSHSACYNDFTAQEDKDGYLVSGTLHLGTDADSSVVRMKAEEETTATVKGLVDCKEGNLRLIYTAPDGTETVIAECEEASRETFNASLTVTKEESALELAGSGKYEVCAFEMLIAGDNLTFYLGSCAEDEMPEMTEDFDTMEIPEEPGKPEASDTMEIPEEPEKPEASDTMEIPDTTEIPKEPGLQEIADRMENDPIIDNWPESIRCAAEGLNGEPLLFEMEIEEPRTLAISCITEKGKLRIQIQDSDGNIVFNEEKIKREDFEALIDTPGLYTVYVWAEQFYGMFEIS